MANHFSPARIRITFRYSYVEMATSNLSNCQSQGIPNFATLDPQTGSTYKKFSFGSLEIYYDELLGSGAFGEVYKAKFGQLPCAAKLNNNNQDRVKSVKFQAECHLLSEIKHPNIVQYLGTARDLRSGVPVLLMELMDENLTKFLERSAGPLPYHKQLNICHDVALALAYLHSNAIIHRDLSSNNL